MKNYFYILISCLLILSSCDKINQPIPVTPGIINTGLFPGDSTAYLSYFDSIESNWTTNPNNKRYILLEDYTGHKCTNCPNAAITAEELQDDTTLGVVVVSVHASPNGAFQATDDSYPTDFTTEAGDVYVVDMPGMFANPMGTINRKKIGLNGTVWHLANSWENAVSQETNQNLEANIQVQTSYFSSTNGLFIHTETEFKSNLVGNYHLIIYLLRNSVVSPQSMDDGTTNYNYNHHHVLSDNINGNWGTEIATGTVVQDSKFYRDFSFELPNDSTYDIDNLSLVSYLCERNTFEVIQVLKTEL
jgi:hypothetical protein